MSNCPVTSQVFLRSFKCGPEAGGAAGRLVPAQLVTTLVAQVPALGCLFRVSSSMSRRVQTGAVFPNSPWASSSQCLPHEPAPCMIIYLHSSLNVFTWIFFF